VAERDEHQILVSCRRIAAAPGADCIVQPPLPDLQPFLPFAGAGHTFIRDVISAAREGIYRSDMRPHPLRQQSRGHRKILVVRLRQVLAGRVGARQALGRLARLRPLGHTRHSNA